VWREAFYQGSARHTGVDSGRSEYVDLLFLHRDAEFFHISGIDF
jgi:hypothetical protein